MTASSKIVRHHVGGRWGNHPFLRLPAFAGDFVEVLDEADTDAIAAIHQAGKDRPGELAVIPACLARRTRRRSQAPDQEAGAGAGAQPR